MTTVNRATDEAKIALESISNTIRYLIEEWEERTGPGLEMTYITLDRVDASSYDKRQSIVRVKCAAEVSARSV